MHQLHVQHIIHVIFQCLTVQSIEIKKQQLTNDHIERYFSYNSISLSLLFFKVNDMYELNSKDIFLLDNSVFTWYKILDPLKTSKNIENE
jgi:hypothetical protein